MSAHARTGSTALDAAAASSARTPLPIGRPTGSGTRSPGRVDDGRPASGAAVHPGGGSGSGTLGSGAFDLGAFARALPSVPSSGGTHYTHGHSASMSSIPHKQLLSPIPAQTTSPGHSHSRSVSHPRPPSNSSVGPAVGGGESSLPPTTNSSSTASSVTGNIAPATPDVFDGTVRSGTCKFFNSQKGYGFINDGRAHELNGEEVFVHYTAISGKSGFRSLAEGEDCEYTLVPGPKGYQATNVTGPGGQPVAGDPKARLPKATPFGVQIGQMPMTPYGGFADPYMQHYAANAAMFGAPGFNPYSFPPTAYMHPQQLQAHAAALAAAAAAAAAAAGVAIPNGNGSSQGLTSPSVAGYGSPAMTIPATPASFPGAGSSPQHGFPPFNAAAASGPYPWGDQQQQQTFSPFVSDRAPGSSPILAPSHVRDAHSAASSGNAPFGGQRASPSAQISGAQRYVAGDQGQRWYNGAFSPAVGSAGTPPAGGDGLLYSSGTPSGFPH